MAKLSKNEARSKGESKVAGGAQLSIRVRWKKILEFVVKSAKTGSIIEVDSKNIKWEDLAKKENWSEKCTKITWETEMLPILTKFHLGKMSFSYKFLILYNIVYRSRLYDKERGGRCDP